LIEKRIKICRWEGNEFVICIDGKPQGGTLTEPRANSIAEWLLEVSDDLIKVNVK